MPPLEEMDQNQQALLWPILTGRAGRDRFGNPVTGPPEELCVRWVEGQSDALRPDGTPIRIDGKITSSEDITIGSTMWLRPLDSDPQLTTLEVWYETGSAGEDTGLVVVEALMGRAPDLKGRFYRREYGVVKFRSESAEE